MISRMINYYKLSLIMLVLTVPFIAYLNFVTASIPRTYQYYLVVSSLEILLIISGYLVRTYEEDWLKSKEGG